MVKRFWNLGLAALVFSAWGALAPSAVGGLVASLTVSVTPQAGGLNLYEYTLVNDPTSTLPIAQFDLAVAADADIQGVFAPSGWGFEAPAGEGYVSFFVESSGAELAPGATGLFSLLSSFGPAEFDYAIIGIVPPNIDIQEGQIQAPGAAVPEPSALALAGLGLALAVGGRRFRS